tara:strand:- start:59 stop:343 length:285 start_codon:yes stop_codon:yes gene_type:complete
MDNKIKGFIAMMNNRFADEPKLRDIRLRIMIVFLCGKHPEHITHSEMVSLLKVTDKTARRLRNILVDLGYAEEKYVDREIVMCATEKGRKFCES